MRIVLSSYQVIAQYVAPIPKLIQHDNLTKANGGLKMAWFYPQNKMQVVGQFQKAEVGFSLPLNYNRKIINFFQSVRNKNYEKIVGRCKSAIAQRLMRIGVEK